MILIEADSGHRTETPPRSRFYDSKKMSLFHVLMLICCAGFAHQVSAAGVFELQVLSIQHGKSETFSGRSQPACDDGQCLPFVHICMNESTTSVSTAPRTAAAATPEESRRPKTSKSTSDCAYAAFDTAPLIKSSESNDLYEFDSSSSPNYELKFSFEVPWPDTFDLAIQIYNQSSSSASKILLTSINSTQTVHALPQDDSWTNKEVANKAASISFRMRVTCDVGFYGRDCNTKCSARDDEFGHYVCRIDGTMQCLEGWRGSLCTQPVCADGCHPDNGRCEEPGECLCRPGWKDTNCSTCIKYPGCAHGGCNGPYECLCEPGWGGANCDLDMNVCKRIAPCRNGGKCRNTYGGYSCGCAEGFSGTDCEIRVDNCKLSPCRNGGACVSNNSTTDLGNSSATNRSNYTCVCPFTYTGRHCEIQAKTCDDNPCQNQGECVTNSPGSSPNGIRSSYTCLCAPGYEGSNCEVETNECASNPCNNGGSCVDEHNGFKCLCATGYTGPTCSTDIDECARTPCLNHGTCLDRVGQFFCVCPVGFSGALCQHISPQAFAASTVGNPCKDANTNPCAHGATCEYRPQSDLQVYCHCPLGYTGRFCEQTDFNAPKNSEEDNLLAIGVDEIHKQASFAAANNVKTTSSVAITIGIALASIATVLLILLGACGWFVFSKRRQQQHDQQYYCASTNNSGGGEEESANSTPNSQKKAKKLSADDDEEEHVTNNRTGAVELNNNNSSLDSAQREAILFAANTLSIMEALDKKRPISNRTRQLTGFDEIDGLRMQQRRAQLLLPQQNNSETIYACKSDYGGTNSARRINNNTVIAHSLRRSPTTLGSASNNNNVAAQYNRLTTYNNTLGRKTQQRAQLAAVGRSTTGAKVANKNLILATENEHRANEMRQKQQQLQQRQSMYSCSTVTVMPDILNTSSTMRRQIKNSSEDVQPRHYRSQYSLDATTTTASDHEANLAALQQQRLTGENDNDNVERRRARSSSHNRRRREQPAPDREAAVDSECLYTQVNKKAKKPSQILTSPSSSPQQSSHCRASPSTSSTASSTADVVTAPMILLQIMPNSSTTTTFCSSPTSPAAIDQPLLYSLEEPSDSYQPPSSASGSARIASNGRALNEHKFLASRL